MLNIHAWLQPLGSLLLENCLPVLKCLPASLPSTLQPQTSIPACRAVCLSVCRDLADAIRWACHVQEEIMYLDWPEELLRVSPISQFMIMPGIASSSSCILSSCTPCSVRRSATGWQSPS
jgi:hypothetical protein